MKAYGEFELDIPAVMRVQLPSFFDALSPEPLTLQNIREIPAGAQGAYMLIHGNRVVYLGKTDAAAGFRLRLERHYHSVQHRRGLDPQDMTFKAVRIFVFSNFDLETMMIEEFEKRLGERTPWNFSGFGSNDPGRNREEQRSAQFDLDYPVDIDREVEVLPGPQTVADAMFALKSVLPYLLRFETAGSWRRPLPEMTAVQMTAPPAPTTTRAVLCAALNALSPDWQATVLPNRVILYREKRAYAEQVEVLRRA